MNFFFAVPSGLQGVAALPDDVGRPMLYCGSAAKRRGEPVRCRQEGLPPRKERTMGRFRLWMAGLVALIIGLPLAEKTYAGAIDIIWASIELADSIIRASEGES